MTHQAQKWKCIAHRIQHPTRYKHTHRWTAPTQSRVYIFILYLIIYHKLTIKKLQTLPHPPSYYRQKKLYILFFWYLNPSGPPRISTRSSTRPPRHYPTPTSLARRCCGRCFLLILTLTLMSHPLPQRSSETIGNQPRVLFTDVYPWIRWFACVGWVGWWGMNIWTETSAAE